MEIKPKRGLSLRWLLLVPVVALTWGGRAEAQQKKPVLPARFSVHITAKYYQLSLKQIVATIGSTAGLSIMIDGDPMSPRENVELDGTLEEALNKIADAFDYKWKVGKGGIVLFNKRFYNRDDAPQTTLPEINHMVKNIVDIFGLANVDPDPSQWPLHVNQLGQSLSDEQWMTLLSRKRVAGRDLTPEQFQHLRAAVMQNTFAAPMQDWTELSERLRALKTTYLVGHRRPDDPAKPGAAPIYDYEIVWHNRDGSLNSESMLITFFGNN